MKVKNLILSNKIIKEIDFISREIKNYIPCEFARKPRSINEIKRWKATEYRLFLLYAGPILLYNTIQNNYYNHFLLFHCAVFILNSKYLISQYLDVAHKMLVSYVSLSSVMYGNDFVVYNVHNLLHICSEVSTYGNLSSFDAFPFENFLGKLKRKVRSKTHVLEQVHRRIEELDSVSTEIVDDNKFPVPINITRLPDDNLKNFCCTKLKFKNIVLTSKLPDNCDLLKNKNIGLI